jgi:hypothetical protein
MMRNEAHSTRPISRFCIKPCHGNKYYSRIPYPQRRESDGHYVSASPPMFSCDKSDAYHPLESYRAAHSVERLRKMLGAILHNQKILHRE